MSEANTTGNGAAAAAVPRDEAKADKNEQNSVEKYIIITEAMLKNLLLHPPLWKAQHYRPIVDKISEIARNPANYPPYADSWGVERTILTPGISNQLTNRTMDRPNKNVLHLQITHVDMTERADPIHINKQTANIGTRQRWKYTAVDGDNNTFLLRIDSTLNHMGMTLVPGTIAKVTSSFPAYFNHDDSNDNRCAVVIRDFVIVGRQPVPDDLLSGGNNNKSAIKAVKKKALPKKRKEEQPSKPLCDGCLCSKHGVAFELCLTKIIPPDTIPLPIVARDCVFANMEVEDMTVYQFHGAGNRIDLPECVIYAVRDLYKKDNIDVEVVEEFENE